MDEKQARETATEKPDKAAGTLRECGDGPRFA
jgi:hypothetical protein